MPHADIKYAPLLEPAALVPMMTAVAELVARHFGEEVDYVSVELVAQGKYTLHRKTIDIEVDSAPGPDSSRRDAVNVLSEALATLAGDTLRQLGIGGDASAYVRVFDAAGYGYWRDA